MVNPFDVDTADAAAIRERLEDGAGSEDGDSAQVDNVMAATAAVKRAARPKLTADL